MAAVIIYGSAALALAFTAAWAFVPAFRAMVERPKDRFAEDVRRYDRAQQAHTGQEGHRV